jgi:hypothetical protein
VMQTNPVKAIREFCVDACCCGSITTVRDCTAAWCPLYAFRFGTNPYRTKRELTEEQREAAKARLSEARSKKEVAV